MTEGRRLWALMAVLTTIALTSFAVQTILEIDSEISLEAQTITGNVVAATDSIQEEGMEGLVDKAANWAMGG